MSRYNQEELQNTPNSSKSITDFLKVNPNVQFSNDHLAANTQANLKPNEISIHGAQTFQNKFMINGVSNTNILDPLGMGSVNYGQIESGSQGVSINTDLLCNLEVLDSNVSAKHGSFTGGVISADTCAPQSEIGKVHGSKPMTIPLVIGCNTIKERMLIKGYMKVNPHKATKKNIHAKD